MFTNLDITDMETCYKLFTGDAIKKIAPTLKEERFGFEPEVTAKAAQGKYRVYECAISYKPRIYEEGKKIGWKDGVHALYCILHYSAHTAPLPMQILLYLFIGTVSMILNMVCFAIAIRIGIGLTQAVLGAFVLAALCNYLLCIAILFQHKARWNTAGELFLMRRKYYDTVIAYYIITFVKAPAALVWFLVEFFLLMLFIRSGV